MPLIHLAFATIHLRPLAAFAASALAGSLWQGAVLTFATWILLQLLPGVSATARFAIWAVVFAVIVLLPFVSLGVVQGRAVASSAGIFHLDARWGFAIVAAWTVASITRFAQLSVGAFRLRKIWCRAIPLAETEILASSTGRHVQVCASLDVDRPSVIGFFAPRVLIPADIAATLSSTDLEHIVLHEASHLRRGDDWMNLLQKFVLAAMPLNPVLAWVERRMCLERELACDDRVLANTGAPRAYALCLTRLAETRLGRRAALSLGAWNSRSELSRRVESILAGEWKTSSRRVYFVVSVVLVVIFTGVMGLFRCPQLVTFTSAPALPAIASTAGYDVATHASLTHTTLVKATMPISGPSPAVIGDGVQPPVHRGNACRLRRTRPGLLRTAITSRTWQPTPARVHAVMVLAPAPSFVPASMIFTVSDDGHLTRAAVSTPEGWIVFQL